MTVTDEHVDDDQPVRRGDVLELTQVARRIQRLVRVRSWMFIAAIIALIIAIGVVVTDQRRLHDVVDGDCAYFATVGTPDTAPVSQLGRQIVISARQAYAGRCARFGELAPLVPGISTAPSTPHR